MKYRGARKRERLAREAEAQADGEGMLTIPMKASEFGAIYEDFPGTGGAAEQERAANMNRRLYEHRWGQLHPETPEDAEDTKRRLAGYCPKGEV